MKKLTREQILSLQHELIEVHGGTGGVWDDGLLDTLLKSTAMELLVKNLGVVETERFISLILKEPFDYTNWREGNLPNDVPVEVLNHQAVEYWNSKYPEAK